MAPAAFPPCPPAHPVNLAIRRGGVETIRHALDIRVALEELERVLHHHDVHVAAQRAARVAPASRAPHCPAPLATGHGCFPEATAAAQSNTTRSLVRGGVLLASTHQIPPPKRDHRSNPHSNNRAPSSCAPAPEQHVPAQFQELVDYLKLHRRYGVVVPRVGLCLRNLHATNTGEHDLPSPSGSRPRSTGTEPGGGASPFPLSLPPFLSPPLPFSPSSVISYGSP